MFSFIFLRLFLILGGLGLFFSALLSWENDSHKLTVEIEGATTLFEELDSKKFPILVTEPIKDLLYRASLETNVDNYAVLELIDLYLQRRPLDVNVWLYGSQFYQRVDDRANAALFLTLAHRLSESNTPILLKVFNRYLEMGMIEEAMPVAHDIVVAKPNEFRRLFYLMSRLSDDYVRVVDEVIPKGIPLVLKSRKEIKPNGYYSWALSDAIKLNNTPLVHAVWQSIPLEFKKRNELGLRYINYLVNSQDIIRAKPAWFDVLGYEMKVGQMLNDLDGSVSVCWNVGKIDGVEVTESLSNAGLKSMKLTFLGDRNLAYNNHLSCIVPIEPNVRYVLTGRSKGRNISTLSGPFVDIIFPNIKSREFRSESIIGSWPWSNFELSFDTPAEARFAKIRIRRKKTQLLDSKISGTVWFNDFKLEKVMTLNSDTNEVLSYE